MTGTGGGDRNRPGAVGSRAFTVVELIVAAAVIAVSAALLFPVFARGRERGRQSACLSNLRQLAAAGIMYAADHDHMNFWYRGRVATTVTDGSGAAVTPWQMGSDNYNITMKAAFAPFMKSTDAWFCPSDPYAHVHTYVGYAAGPGGQCDKGYGEHLTPLPSIKDDADGGTPWFDQLNIDHYYGSYRFYTHGSGDPTAPGTDSPPPSQFDVSYQKTLTSGAATGTVVTVSTRNNLFFLEEYNVHASADRSTGSQLPIYGRSAAYSDGHAKWMAGNEYNVH